MKLASFLTAIFNIVAFTTSMTVPEPSGASCWNTTLAIIGSEAFLASTSSSLIDQERVYILCSQTYKVGIVPPNTTMPVGGGFPMTIFNPNIHIMCEEAGTCIFEGGHYQLTNLGSNTLLETFLALSGLKPLPDGYFVDSSNLIVEGMVFRGAMDTGADNIAFSNVQFGGPGVNITIKDCLWTEQDTDYPPYSGVALFIPKGENVTTETGTIYIGLALLNCTFRNNVFTYAAIRVGDTSNSTNPQLMSLTVEDTVFEDNVISSADCICKNSTKSSTNEFSAVVSVIRVQGSMANCVLKSNSMERARAAIVALYSDFEVDTDTVAFMDNSIDDAIGNGCTNIANVTMINGNWSQACLDDDSVSPGKSSAGSLSTVGIVVLAFVMSVIENSY